MKTEKAPKLKTVSVDEELFNRVVRHYTARKGHAKICDIMNEICRVYLEQPQRRRMNEN